MANKVAIQLQPLYEKIDLKIEQLIEITKMVNSQLIGYNTLIEAHNALINFFNSSLLNLVNRRSLPSTKAASTRSKLNSSFRNSFIKLNPNRKPSSTLIPAFQRFSNCGSISVSPIPMTAARHWKYNP